MSVRQWIRHILETPEERLERRRTEFLARMYVDPDNTIKDSLRRAAKDFRARGYIRDDDDLPKAA